MRIYQYIFSCNNSLKDAAAVMLEHHCCLADFLSLGYVTLALLCVPLSQQLALYGL